MFALFYAETQFGLFDDTFLSVAYPCNSFSDNFRDLKWNRITAIPKETFDDLTSLQEL